MAWNLRRGYWQCVRWWHVTTDKEFLLSAASRRNAWKVLLPVPGLLAMLTDAGFSNLMILDAYATVAFLVVAFLPPGMLWSDLAIFLVHAVFYMAHSLLVRDELSLSDDKGDTPELWKGDTSELWNCQLLSIFSMASAGVHSVAMVAFNIFVIASSLFLQDEIRVVQLLVCLYVLATACFAERRLAQLVTDVQGADFAYRALDFAGEEEPDSARHSVEPLMAPPPAVPAGTVLTFSSDEEQEGLQSTRPRARFAAAQVRPPAAATHEAAVAVERLEIATEGRAEEKERHAVFLQVGATPASETVLSPFSPGNYSPSASTALSADRFAGHSSPRIQATGSNDRSSPAISMLVPQSPMMVLRGIKMHGFQTLQLNVLFIESRDINTQVNGRETYWSEANDFFMYYSEGTTTWGLAKARRFQAIVEGRSNGVAHSPSGYELWETRKGPKKEGRLPGDWREWDSELGKWVIRPHSGIETRGKVRPKACPHEKAVQTELVMRDKECQTER